MLSEILMSAGRTILQYVRVNNGERVIIETS
jgi:hypothetical protein